MQNSIIINVVCHSAVVEDHGVNDNSVIVMGECGEDSIKLLPGNKPRGRFISKVSTAPTCVERRSEKRGRREQR